ncbi:MAG: hypothetical protein CM15mV20_0860 [uncultured marine virus]|nr:MAG: hypothetical protein CM15mV20_0860 [uncultured marine virus]
MASIIRVKRSTGTTAPGTLNFGELGLTIGVGNHGNKGGRLFAGDNAGNPQEIGGRYFTDLLSIAPGLVAGQANPTTAANGFVAVLDQNRKVDQWNVDNLTLDGNTFSSTNTDGDLIFNPGGSGEVMVPDDTKLGFGGGADGTGTADATIEYDEDGTDKVLVSGASWQFNCGIGITGGTTIDNIQIKQDTIASTSGDTMFIDPFPDGLSSEGLLVVKGSLQVDGTTTTVNSTNATLNDPVMHIGDVTSKLTVLTHNVAVGVSTVTVDSVVGINTGDTIAAAGLPNSGLTTVTAYNTTTNVITYTGVSTAGITTGAQITVTHAFDTNTDRGIAFSYNTGTGVGNNKKGFFGYIDEGSSNTLSNAPDRSWTYIPEASVAGNNATGVRGFLDVKGLYFQSSDYASGGNGIMYFDTTGKSVVSAGTTAGITTSNFVLTTNAAGIPKWTNTLDGGTF